MTDTGWLDDPDADPTVLRRRRLSNLVLTVGILAVVPVLPVVGLLTLFGVVGGLAPAVGTVAAGGLLIGAVLRRGTTPERLYRQDMAVAAEVIAQAEVDGIAGAAQVHDALVERLLSVGAAVATRTRGPALGAVRRAAGGAAFRTGLDLRAAGEDLEVLAVGAVEDPPTALAAIRQAHRRCEEVIGHLEAIVANLPEPRAAAAEAEDERHRLAMAELSWLQDWVAARQTALAELEPPSTGEGVGGTS